jgi:hypothetical protein
MSPFFKNCPGPDRTAKGADAAADPRIRSLIGFGLPVKRHPFG